MEGRVVRITTVFMVIFTIVAGVTLFFLPELHASQIAVLEEQVISERDKDNAEVVNVDMDGQAGMEEAIDFPQQLRIALPEGVGEQNVTITNQYLTQTVDIVFPETDENYLYNHPIMGRSNNIDNLTFESEKDRGIIEITLDKVFEIQPTFADGYLYIDFLAPHDIYDKVVVIDAGHGGRMPGATIQNKCEKDIDLAIVQQLKQIFEENPNDKIGVYYTRMDDSNPSFEQRVGLANKADADIFISVHNNATVSGKMSSVNGTAVMYDELKEETPNGTKALAQICVDEVSGVLGSRNRGVINGNEIYIIRNSEVPVALIEVGFMTNQTELNNLTSEEYQRKAAQGIYNAIMRAFNEGF